VKLCECGCGQPVPIAKRNRKNRGHVKGQPLRFVKGHHLRLLVGERSPNWKGGTHNPEAHRPGMVFYHGQWYTPEAVERLQGRDKRRVRTPEYVERKRKRDRERMRKKLGWYDDDPRLKEL
jgi:hypothetical protein